MESGGRVGTLTTASRLLRVAPVLIGLWKFHHASWAKNRWCCTWRHRGQYYDTFARLTPDAALDAVWRNWNNAKRRRRPMPI